MTHNPIHVFFHEDQLHHKPRYEWAFGKKLPHPETTTRADNILRAIRSDVSGFQVHAPVDFPLGYLREIHSSKLITLYRTARKLAPDVTYYPSVFPKRNHTFGDPNKIEHSGYFCFDSGTPLNHTTYNAAAWSAACAEAATRLILDGKEKLSYALCRPPGHHAARDLFGGYCYFNNAGLAAHLLGARGKVVILDIDFHHGNGTQSLYYRDPNVLFISIHGDPSVFYPFYWGFENEKGQGEGEGFNLNIPIPSGCDGQEYLRILRERVIPVIQAFQPAALVLSAGLDTYREDPIGKFCIDTPDYHPIGVELGRLGLPTVAIQEGGYCTKMLGANVTTLLRGLRDGQTSVFFPSTFPDLSKS